MGLPGGEISDITTGRLEKTGAFCVGLWLRRTQVLSMFFIFIFFCFHVILLLNMFRFIVSINLENNPQTVKLGRKALNDMHPTELS